MGPAVVSRTAAVVTSGRGEPAARSAMVPGGSLLPWWSKDLGGAFACVRCERITFATPSGKAPPRCAHCENASGCAVSVAPPKPRPKPRNAVHARIAAMLIVPTTLRAIVDAIGIPYARARRIVIALGARSRRVVTAAGHHDVWVLR